MLPNSWMLLAIAYSCHAQDGSKQIMQICFNTVPADNGWSHGRRKEKVYIHRDDPVRYHLKYDFHPAVFCDFDDGLNRQQLPRIDEVRGKCLHIRRLLSSEQPDKHKRVVYR